MKKIYLINLISLLLAISTSSCKKGEADKIDQSIGAFFADDFESGDDSKTMNGFEWSGNTVEVAMTPNGTMGLKFAFGPDDLIEDSWREQRFNLGADYPELWIKYDLYIPENFYHRCPVHLTLEQAEQGMLVGDTVYLAEQDGSIKPENSEAWGVIYATSGDSVWVDKLLGYHMFLDGYYMINRRTNHISQVKKRLGYGTNNKFMLIWQGEYGSTSTGNMVDFEYWSVDRGNSQLSRYLSVDQGDKLRNEGHKFSKEYIISKEEDTGKWMELIFHIKIASAADNDGIIHVQKNGKDYLNVTDVGNYSEKGYNYYQHGYLLGWSNSGFKEETIMYIDNVVFSTKLIKSNR